MNSVDFRRTGARSAVLAFAMTTAAFGWEVVADGRRPPPPPRPPALLAPAAKPGGYFTGPAGDLYFQRGAAVTREGTELARILVTRDRQTAWGLRADGLLLKYDGGARPYVLQTRVESIHLNADGQSAFVKRRSRAAFPAHPADGYTFIAPDHVERIRRDPAAFDDLYQAYRGQVLRELGARFAGLNEEGKMAVFAAMAAYQMKPYGANAARVDSNRDATLARLLAAPKMSCDRYCYLAMLLYERGRVNARLRPLRWNMVGFDTNSALGNHAQLFVGGAGVPLMLDPTFGLVARAELSDLLAGRPVPYVDVREPAYRVEGDAALASGIFHQNIGVIRHALVTGGYPRPRHAVSPGWTPVIYQHAEDVLGL